MEASCRDFDQSLCCIVQSMFGFTLKKSVILISLITLVTAGVALVLSIVGISMCNATYTTRPVEGVGLLFSMFCFGIASYQIFVSTILLWTTVMKNGSIFVCSIWYISHLSIVFGYSCFFIATAVSFFLTEQDIYGILLLVTGIVYASSFGYFCAIVNSYAYMLGGPLYYY